jgi:hypothetical protein
MALICAGGGCDGDRPEVVEVRDIAADAGKPENEIERKQRHGLSPKGGDDETSQWPRSGAPTLSKRKVIRPKAGNPVPSGACRNRTASIYEWVRYEE